MVRVNADTLVPGNIIYVGALVRVVRNEILGPLRTLITLRGLMDPNRQVTRIILRNVQIPLLDIGPDAIVLDGMRLRAIVIPDDEPDPEG